MMKTIYPAALTAGAACILLAACGPPSPGKPIPPGPTSAEVVDYAIAQAQYRSAQAMGNGDVVMQGDDTFYNISQEILSRDDPRLFEAWLVCARYRVAGPDDPPDVRSTFEPRFVRDCERIVRQYNQAANAIRRDLEAKIAAADLATIAQPAAGHP